MREVRAAAWLKGGRTARIMKADSKYNMWNNDMKEQNKEVN
jgi:hypothetical protein